MLKDSLQISKYSTNISDTSVSSKFPIQQKIVSYEPLEYLDDLREP